MKTIKGAAKAIGSVLLVGAAGLALIVTVAVLYGALVGGL